MSEECDICKELFRPNPAHVRVICYGCSRKGRRNQIDEFLEDLKWKNGLTRPMLEKKWEAKKNGK